MITNIDRYDFIRKCLLSCTNEKQVAVCIEWADEIFFEKFPEPQMLAQLHKLAATLFQTPWDLQTA